jgi:hypothetical protein
VLRVVGQGPAEDRPFAVHDLTLFPQATAETTLSGCTPATVRGNPRLLTFAAPRSVARLLVLRQAMIAVRCLCVASVPGGRFHGCHRLALPFARAGRRTRSAREDMRCCLRMPSSRTGEEATGTLDGRAGFFLDQGRWAGDDTPGSVPQTGMLHEQDRMPHRERLLVLEAVGAGLSIKAGQP